jgi:hypothetical protein
VRHVPVADNPGDAHGERGPDRGSARRVGRPFVSTGPASLMLVGHLFETGDHLVNEGVASISANIDAVRDVQHEVKRVEQKLLLDDVRRYGLPQAVTVSTPGLPGVDPARFQKKVSLSRR